MMKCLSVRDWTFLTPNRKQDESILRSSRAVESGKEKTVPVSEVLKMLRKKPS